MVAIDPAQGRVAVSAPALTHRMVRSRPMLDGALP
jgi:hypothetical protein